MPEAPPVASELVAGLALPDTVITQSLEISASVWVEGFGAVWSHNPDLQLYPASNQKLLTGAGALHLLPPDHTFASRILEHDGALTFVAGGDPTLDSAGLQALARQVRATGISGASELRIDASRYASERMAPGWQDWQMPTYTGPLSTFTLDANRWTKDQRFLDQPDLVNGERLADALRVAGVSITGAVVLGPVPDNATPVAEVSSPPVDELVQTMMLRSDNAIAESLVREIGYVRGDLGSMAVGTETIRSALAADGFELGGENGDGSGLSRANLHSGRDWQEFLVAVQQADWFDRFDASLPVAGRSGTMGRRLTGSSTVGNVRAKTGTIIGGRALSGYLTLASGQEAAFSIIVNGETSHQALGLIDNWVTAVARLDLPDET